MANIINEKNHLEDEFNLKNRRQYKVVLIFTLIVLSLFFFYEPTFASVVAIIGYGIIRLFINEDEANILKSGIEGEKRALYILNQLDSNYSIISDLEIEIDDKKSQIDSVVVGPNGIFVVETKNVKGYVYGKEDDQELIIDKVGRKGGSYSNRMYNPCKQVNTHVFRLSKLLKSNGIHQWVQGAVFFSNPETNIDIITDKIPVFAYNRDSDDIVSFIKNYKCEKEISIECHQKIVDLLKNYIMV